MSSATATALDVFFDLVPTGAALYAPVFEAHGELTDFRFVRLNPAGQRLLGLPAEPPRTFREYYPHSVPTGIFAQYRTAYLTGEASTYDVPYAGDGLDTFFRLVAQRSGELLVVSFTDMGDLPHAAVEASLRASRAREQAARAEAERQRGELERVFEQAPVAIAVYRGPTYTIELANATVARLWGRTREQLLGKGLFEALPEVAGMGYEQLLDTVMATGVPHVAQAMEAQHARDGQLDTVYWDFVYVPMYAAEGHINGAMVVATEVTAQVLARRQMEQHAQELESRVQERTRQLVAAQATAEQQRQQWHELFMQAPAGICIFDGPEWVYEFVNPGYQAMFPGRALLGKPLLTALPELAGQPLLAILHHVYDTGEPFEAREVLVPLARTEQGGVEDIYFDLTYQARRNAAGQIDGFVTYATDVTAQVLARREREAQQGLLQRTFEQAPVAIFVVRGTEYVFDVVNAPMSALLGRPREQLLGRRYFDAVPELATQGYKDLLDEVWRTGRPLTMQEREGALSYHRPGEPGYFNFVYQPIRDERGQFTSIACVTIEVTDQVVARQQVQALNAALQTTNDTLHETNRQLTRTNADLDTFVYAASHDLKSPIANIEGLLGVLHDYLPAAAMQEPMVTRVLGMMRDAVGRFQQTVAHLSDVTRLEVADEAVVEEMDIAHLLEDICLDLQPLLESTQARVQVQLAGCPTIRLAAKPLRSILFNLLSNAVKYRAPDRPPVVHIRAHCSATQYVLEVQDNGLGLSEEQQRHLFIMFRRLHTHVEGSGVGLYLIRRLIELAGGHITVQSAVDVGSTFTVTLPRAAH